MPVKVRCQSCEKVFAAPDAARGKLVKCPGCEGKVKVPAGDGAKSSAGAKAPAFGMELPAEVPDRDVLRARSLELLKQWLGKLEPEHKDKIRAQLAGYGIGSGPPIPAPPPDEPAA